MKIVNIGIALGMGILALTVIMDLFLWVVSGYMVPCWTVSAFSLVIMLLLYVLSYYLNFFHTLETQLELEQADHSFKYLEEPNDAERIE